MGIAQSEIIYTKKLEPILAVLLIQAFPFKGKVGMGMGLTPCASLRSDPKTHPHLVPPLEGEEVSQRLPVIIRARNLYCAINRPYDVMLNFYHFDGYQDFATLTPVNPAMTKAQRATTASVFL